MVNFANIYEYIKYASKGDLLVFAKLDDTIPISEQPIFHSQIFWFDRYDDGEIWVRFYGKKSVIKLVGLHFKQPITWLPKKYYNEMQKRP